MSKGSEGTCRYFLSGSCSRGTGCKYSHDEASSRDVCRFFMMGSCNYGTACRFLHDRSAKANGAKTKENTSTNMKAIPPVKLAPVGLNVEAPVFVPSWLAAEKPEPTSYACAVGSNSSEATTSSNIALCPYFSESGECSREDCRFLHGVQCEMCQKWCLNPDDEYQQQQHFAECSSQHEVMMHEAFAVQKSREKTCGICMESIYEKNLRFGILENCKHCFCLDCIREWRKNNEEFENTVVRSCPECRVLSYFVIPSVIWLEEEDEKSVLLDAYMENTKQKQCKYYKGGAVMEECPFGNKCFYRHQLPDGTIDEGQEPHERRRPRLADFLFREDEIEEVLSSLDEWSSVLQALSR